uniref:Ribonuclease P protein subunit p30 n=1 Tax=Panagrellus redivivus TaxID=6233 RepID=A0A7E4VWC9_PANRE
MPPKKLPLRPYVGNTSRLEFHKDENVVSNGDLVVDFLLKAGKRRKSAAKKLVEPDEVDEEYKSKFITIGFRQTIKAFNADRLAWVLVSETLTQVTAVGNVFGLMATNLAKTAKFYVTPGLLATISQKLELPRISVIGFGPDCSELASVFHGLKHVELVSRTAKATFQIPPLSVAVGKPEAKINAKKQRKLKKKQQRKGKAF